MLSSEDAKRVNRFLRKYGDLCREYGLCVVSEWVLDSPYLEEITPDEVGPYIESIAELTDEEGL